MDNTRFYLGFNLTPGMGPARVARLIAHCGSAEAAWHADDFDLAAAGVEPRAAAALLAARSKLNLDAELERAEQAGIALLTLEHPDYPRLLREIPGAPPLIYVRGALSPADDWAVAVVGTRAPSPYGKEAALHIAADLARAGVCVVSGLAFGIDTVAHTAALDADGRTIAVLGSGVDVPYPERNRRLADRIAEQGALISDFPLGSVPLPANFPARNRIISGLSCGTLVVEAAERSGALITVEFALEQGREVFAVPGPIFARQSAGPLRLLRDGAGIATCADDLLSALEMTRAVVQHEARVELPSDPVEAAVLAGLGYAPLHIDELARAIALPTPVVTAALAMLELKGLVRQPAAMQYVLSR